VRCLERVHIAKHIRHQRQVTATASRDGKGAAGKSDNENGGFVTH